MKNREIFMGNLNFDMAEGEIRSICSEAGNVESVVIKKKKKGIAFVTMSTPEEAEKAVELLDGRKLYGRNIRVSLKLRPGAAKKNTIKRYTEDGENIHREKVKKAREIKERAEKKKSDREHWESKYGSRMKKPGFRGRDTGSETEREHSGSGRFSGNAGRYKNSEESGEGQGSSDRSRNKYSGGRSHGSSSEYSSDFSRRREGFGKGRRDDHAQSGKKHGSGFRKEGRYNDDREGRESRPERGSRGTQNFSERVLKGERSGHGDNRKDRRDREFSGDGYERNQRPRRVSGSVNRQTGRPSGRKKG